MKKKIIALVLSAAMVLCAIPSYAYSVKDAYSDFVAQYPEFVNTVLENGNEQVTEKLIIEFLGAIQRNLNNKHRFEGAITEDNFDDALVDAVLTVSSADKYSPLQSALMRSYPDAVYEAATTGKVSGELQPIYDVVKSMIFDHNMLEEIDTNMDSTTALVSVEPIDSITVSAGDSISLPKWGITTSETGATVRLEIDWTEIPETTSAGTYTAKGTVVVPDGFKLEFDKEVSVTVTVEGDSKDTDKDTDKDDDKNNNKGGGSTGGGGGKGTTSIGGTTTVVTEPVVHKYSFTDVTEATDEGKAIYALTDAGILTGYPDKTFKPNLTVTRAEFVTMMVRALDMLDANSTSAFTDVPTTEWYYAHVSSAVKNGLVNGYEDNTFHPTGSITRAEVMTILYRTLNGKKLLTAVASNAKFADDASVPTWASEYVYSLYSNKIVSADKDNKIRAEVNATREECAVMIYSTLKAMGKIK